MNNYLKRYKVYLKTLGPVFIGSGKLVRKRDWVLDTHRGIGYMLDERKMFHYLMKTGRLDSFEEFMISDRWALFVWVKENGIFPNKMDRITKYELDCDNIADLNTIKDVQTFIKDGYGMPYVPGSSLKGVIRNALLSYFISKDPDKGLRNDVIRNVQTEYTRNPKQFLKKETRGYTEKYLRTRRLPDTKNGDAVNDIMSGIRISDSRPREFSDLTLCQKIDMCVDGKGNNLSVLRECIKPGTRIELEITIDSTVTEITIKDIEDTIRYYLNNYNNEFLSKFKSEQQYNDDVIYLGGGTGYHTKTITSTVLAEEPKKVEYTANIINGTLTHRVRQEHHHDRDRHMGASPHTAKLTEYDRDLYQFGPCRISFQEF